MTGNGTETMEWEEYSKYMKYQIGKCYKSPEAHVAFHGQREGWAWKYNVLGGKVGGKWGCRGWYGLTIPGDSNLARFSLLLLSSTFTSADQGNRNDVGKDVCLVVDAVLILKNTCWLFLTMFMLAVTRLITYGDSYCFVSCDLSSACFNFFPA